MLLSNAAIARLYRPRAQQSTSHAQHELEAAVYHFQTMRKNRVG